MPACLTLEHNLKRVWDEFQKVEHTDYSQSLQDYWYTYFPCFFSKDKMTRGLKQIMQHTPVNNSIVFMTHITVSDTNFISFLW